MGGLVPPTEKTVAYLGPAGTHSHLAAVAIFGPVDEMGFRYLAEGNLAAVVKAVAGGSAGWGVVPYFNTMGGPLRSTHPALLDFARSQFADLEVLATVSWRVRHSLLGYGPMEAVKRVYSKREVFEQVPRWLETHLVQAAPVECDSTAAAVRRAERDGPEAAAIASRQLLVFHRRLRELARNIQDSDPNITRFLLLRRAGAGSVSTDDELGRHTWVVFNSSFRTANLQKMLSAADRWGIAASAISGKVVDPENFEMRFLMELAHAPSSLKVRFLLSETAHLSPIVIGAPFVAHVDDLTGLKQLVEHLSDEGVSRGKDAVAMEYLSDQVRELLGKIHGHRLYTHAPVSDMESVWEVLGVPPERMLNTQVLRDAASQRIAFCSVPGDRKVDTEKVCRLLGGEFERVTRQRLRELGQAVGAESPLTAPEGAEVVVDASVAGTRSRLFLGSGHCAVSVAVPPGFEWPMPVTQGDIALTED